MPSDPKGAKPGSRLENRDENRDIIELMDFRAPEDGEPGSLGA